MTRPSVHTTSRRRFLEGVVATGVAVTAGCLAMGSADFRLGATSTHWIGEAPDRIADRENPELEVVPGEEYSLVWENLDGAKHNFTIVDDTGRIVHNSAHQYDQGATQRVEFTAERGFAEYYSSCGCGSGAEVVRAPFEVVETR